ncbi:ArdC family protein [Mesorhizobium sp.]|uniref:ArdC family protein n=2 Tax=Mesorhizobium TaxID=68287 RepID=UPI00338EF718
MRSAWTAALPVAIRRPPPLPSRFQGKSRLASGGITMHARQRTASGEIGEGGRSGDRLYQEFPHRIIADLESGTIPWVKPCCRAKIGLGLPRNASGASATNTAVKEPAAVAAWLNKASRWRRGAPCGPWRGE